MIHVDKMRILEANCDKEKRIAGMKGPDARVHYEYHAKHHSAAYVGEKVIVTGHIVDKYVKRGRPYLWYYLEVLDVGRAPGNDVQRSDRASVQGRRSMMMSDKPSFNVGDELVGPVRAITRTAHRVVRQRDAVGRDQRVAAGRRPTSTPTRNSPGAKASPPPTPTA